MTKKDMAKTIAEELGLPINIVREAIQMVMYGTTDVLVDQGRIEFVTSASLRSRYARRGKVEIRERARKSMSRNA